MRQPYPILEFDPAPEGIIEPRKLIEPIDAPEHCVVCFFQEVIAGLAAQGRLILISTRKSEIGAHPVYQMEVDGRRLALFHPGVGAPLAAGLLDEVIPLGCCLTVEMEAAAFFAVAQFRDVLFAQLLYGGDDVSGEVWDHRDYASRLTVREKLFWLAAEACLLL
jgi:hypothetical protein